MSEPVVEYAQMMSGGGYQIRCDDPEVEDIYPTPQWVAAQIRLGGHVYRRRIIVVEDWVELSAADIANLR